MPEHYYTVIVKHETWIPVLGRLLKPYATDPKVEVVAVDIHPDATATYYINKEVVPAAALASALGLQTAAVAIAPRIVLKRLAAEKNWPEPTVAYVGEA